MKKNSTPFNQSRPYLKNYFSLLKEFEQNKATLLKEELKRPIIKITEDIYNKYSANLESYMQKNKGKVNLYGSTKYENASIEAFIEELQTYKQTILKQIKDNPFVSANLNYNNPSEDMILTPLPDKPRKMLKEKREKKEFDSAERTAVVMRIVEYTHRLKKENKSIEPSSLKGGKGIVSINENRSVFLVLKKAVNVVQIWWKSIKKNKTKNINTNKFVWLMKVYIRKKSMQKLKNMPRKKRPDLGIVEKPKNLEILIKGRELEIEVNHLIDWDSVNSKGNYYIIKRSYNYKDYDEYIKTISYIQRRIRRFIFERKNKLKYSKLIIITKQIKKPINQICQSIKICYDVTYLIILQKAIIRFLNQLQLKRIKYVLNNKPILITKVPSFIITKTIVIKDTELLTKRSNVEICCISKKRIKSLSTSDKFNEILKKLHITNLTSIELPCKPKIEQHNQQTETEEEIITKTLIKHSYYTKDIKLVKPIIKEDKGINTNITSRENYMIINQIKLSYINLSVPINKIALIYHHHLSQTILQTLYVNSLMVKQKNMTLKLITSIKNKSLCYYFNHWGNNSLRSSYSIMIKTKKGKNYNHSFQYKTKIASVSKLQCNLYQLSVGFKYLPKIFYQSTFDLIHQKVLRTKSIKCIELVLLKHKREFFYRLILNDLMLHSININKKSTISLLKKGSNNTFHKRLESILKLNLTNNTYNDINLTFQKYVQKLIGEDEDNESVITDKESMNNGIIHKYVPDEINDFYICRNVNRIKNGMSPEISDDDDAYIPKQINSTCFSPPTINTYKTTYVNTNSERLRYVPRKNSHPGQVILLRDINMPNEDVLF